MTDALFQYDDERGFTLRGLPWTGSWAIKNGKKIYLNDIFIGTAQEMQEIADEDMPRFVESRMFAKENAK